MSLQSVTLHCVACCKVVSLLELVRSSSNKMPEAAALFFDELANIMEQRQLDRKVEVGLGTPSRNIYPQRMQRLKS